MINFRESHKLQGSVLVIRGVGDSVFCIDNSFFVSQIDSHLKLQRSIQVSKDMQTPHRYSHAFGISPRAYFCIFGESKVFILGFEDQKIGHIATLSDHDGDIESCNFSHDGKFFVTGGQDGRVFIYDGESFLPIASLLARADYISVISYSSNNEFVALGGYDKFTLIFDIVRHKIVFNFVTSDVVEDLCFFENDEKIILVCRNGASIIFGLNEGKILSQEHLFSSWPTSIAIDEEENYALVGTRSEKLYIVSLKNNAKVIEIENEFSGISSLIFFKGLLYIGCTDGMLFIVDYNEGRESLRKCLDEKDYKGAMAVVKDNIFLNLHPLMKVFDEAWPDIFNQAIDWLNLNKIDRAIELVEPFMFDVEKKNEFDFYLSQKEEVKKFAKFIEEKDYQKAYEMLQTAKFLVKTKPYERLEGLWNKAFFNAKELLMENAMLNQRLAKQYLLPFENTPKKELIVQVLRNCDVFVKADTLIKKQDFKEYFSLTFQFSFLRDTDLYKKVLSLGERLFANMLELERLFDYQEAKKLANILLAFPTLKRSAQERIVFIQQKESLLEAIDKKDIKRVYTLVDEIENLRYLAPFKEFTNDFLRLYEEAKPFAYRGNAVQIMSILHDYMGIVYWVDKIAFLMKTAYLRQISDALSEMDVNWNLTLKRYLDRFGKGIELVKLLEDTRCKAVLDSFEGDGKADGYRHQSFVENIVIYIV